MDNIVHDCSENGNVEYNYDFIDDFRTEWVKHGLDEMAHSEEKVSKTKNAARMCFILFLLCLLPGIYIAFFLKYCVRGVDSHSEQTEQPESHAIFHMVK